MILAKSPVCAFGCVELNGVRHNSLVIRNCSNECLRITLRICNEDGETPSTVFSLLSSSFLTLNPAEETTLLFSFHPVTVEEYLGIVLLTSVPLEGTTESNTVGISLVGYGGCAQVEVKESENGLVIGNHGNRTLSLFVLSLEK